MGRKTRLANKTVWSLEDIIALSKDAQTDWVRAFEIAERNQDPLMLAYLGRIGKVLGDIQIKAKDARNGNY